MWRHFKDSLLFNALLMLLAVIVGFSTFNMLLRVTELYREKRTGEARENELSQKNSELEARLAEFGTAEAREREAKERLNLKLHGEEVVVVVPEEKRGTDVDKSRSFWAKVLKILHLPR